MLVLAGMAACCALDLRGPYFTNELRSIVELSNSSGARIDCIVHSSASVSIRWIDANRNEVVPIAGIR